MGGRGELVAAELGQGRLAAGADDQDHLLAPFALLAGHDVLVVLTVLVVDTVLVEVLVLSTSFYC